MRTTASWPHGWAAAFGEGPTTTRLATLRVPCLLLSGERTRRPAAAVARLLERSLPTVTTVALPGLGHLGPLTDPSTVDAEIEVFLGVAGLMPAEFGVER